MSACPVLDYQSDSQGSRGITQDRTEQDLTHPPLAATRNAKHCTRSRCWSSSSLPDQREDGAMALHHIDGRDPQAWRHPRTRSILYPRVWCGSKLPTVVAPEA